MNTQKTTYVNTIVYILVLCSIYICPSGLYAEDFQLIVCISLTGGQADPLYWREVLRYRIADTGGTATSLSSIPNGQVFDPEGAAFRYPDELFIGNRHGNVLDLGSISRFRLDSEGGYTYLGNFTTPGMTAVHELSFNPISGELFAVSHNTSKTFRFTFDGDNPQPNGYFSGGPEAILISPLGNRIFETIYSGILLQFQINLDETITSLNSITVPGAQELHMMGLHPSGEMYIADFYADGVFRYILTNGDPIYNGFVDAYRAIDVAFSPDGQEMFVSYANGDLPTGGVYRYLYQSATDSWEQYDVIYTPRAAGIAVTPMPTPKTLETNVLDGEGTVTANVGYEVGTVVSLEASPDPGYQLKAWYGTDDDSSTETTNEVTIDTDQIVEVEFEPITYQVTLTETGIPSPTQPTIISATFGMVQSLSIVPPQGYCIKSWQGTDDDSSRENTNQVTVDADKQVTVDYASIISPTKCIIKSQKQSGLVNFNISGDIQTSVQQISSGDRIIFKIWSDDIIVYEKEIPFDIVNLNNGKYIYKNSVKQSGQTVVESFVLNLKNYIFTTSGKNVEMSAELKFPLYIEIEIGGYSGLGKVDENMDTWMIMMKD